MGGKYGDSRCILLDVSVVTAKELGQSTLKGVSVNIAAELSGDAGDVGITFSFAPSPASQSPSPTSLEQG